MIEAKGIRASSHRWRCLDSVEYQPWMPMWSQEQTKGLLPWPEIWSSNARLFWLASLFLLCKSVVKPICILLKLHTTSNVLDWICGSSAEGKLRKMPVNSWRCDCEALWFTSCHLGTPKRMVRRACFEFDDRSPHNRCKQRHNRTATERSQGK